MHNHIEFTRIQSESMQAHRQYRIDMKLFYLEAPELFFAVEAVPRRVKCWARDWDGL